jgi:glucosyl-dolichyl phosphate glucuronosyltransferase
MMSLDVSVIVCTWNRASMLEEALGRLLQLQPPSHIHWELVVIDNNSDDHTRAVAQALIGRLPLRYIFESQQGLSRARNRGVAEARGRLLLFMDDDVIVDPGWLAAMYESSCRHPRGGVFGGPVTPRFEHAPDADIAAAYPAVVNGLCGVDYGHTERTLDPSEYVVGANFAVRKEAIEELAFDVELGSHGADPAGGEEVKLQDAIRGRGWDVVWVPGMRVQHYVASARLTVSYLRQFVYHRSRSSVRVSPLPGHPTILGVPRWLLMHYARTAYRLLRSRALPTRAARLAALHEYDRARGLLRGTFDQSRLDPKAR